METEFDGDPVAGGTFPALIWNTFAKRALAHLDEPPESFPYPSYEPIEARQVVFRNNKTLLDNGNCRGSRQILYFVGTGPEAEADCKPNEVDVPDVIGSRLADGEGAPRLDAARRRRDLAAGASRASASASWSTRGRGAGRSPPGARCASSSRRATNGRVPNVVGLIGGEGAKAAREADARALADLRGRRTPGRRRGPVPARGTRGHAQHDRAPRHRPRLTRPPAVSRIRV